MPRPINKLVIPTLEKLKTAEGLVNLFVRLIHRVVQLETKDGTSEVISLDLIKKIEKLGTLISKFTDITKLEKKNQKLADVATKVFQQATQHSITPEQIQEIVKETMREDFQEEFLSSPEPNEEPN